jgi:hypothetical protein
LQINLFGLLEFLGWVAGIWVGLLEFWVAGIFGLGWVAGIFFFLVALFGCCENVWLL